MEEAFYGAIERLVDERYSLAHDGRAAPIKYGTAGFRTVGELLPPIAARVTPIVLLEIWSRRAREGGGDEARVMESLACSGTGMMITASHNPPRDNGLKLIGSDGAMLSAQWEPWCYRAANAASGSEVVQVLRECASTLSIALPSRAVAAKTVVHLGRDTRPSGEAILQAIQRALQACGCAASVDHGVITTPQMHYIVWRSNTSASAAECASVGEKLYYEEICTAFSNLVRPLLRRGVAPTSHTAGHTNEVKRTIVVDASNGVGALALKKLLAASAERADGGNLLTSMFTVHVVDDRTGEEGMLNKECGADHAKTTAQPSAAMRELHERGVADERTHFYCLDGDADRLAGFYVVEASNSGNAREATWSLIDGDRMSILFAMLCHRWLGDAVMTKLDVGVVMTGYTNGAARRFIEERLHMKTYVAATGVKNLHPVAHARDIGVYFEANGHGTALINEEKIRKVLQEASVGGADRVIDLVTNARAVLSQVCGDAIADMLMCEVALLVLDMSFHDLGRIYTDMPVLQTKVTVRYPQRITTTPDETRARTPDGLQEEIDRAVAAAVTASPSSSSDAAASVSARAFVRASGTEPIVRVFVEASDARVCETLSHKVTEAVIKYCN